MKTQSFLSAQPGAAHSDRQRAVHLLRAAATDTGQCDARREWIRAGTQC